MAMSPTTSVRIASHAGGDVLRLAIARTTRLPSRVTSMASHPNMGDVTIATTFSDYEEVNGLQLPSG